MPLRPATTPGGTGADPEVAAARLERDRAQELLVAACAERDGCRRDVADCDCRIAALERLMVLPDCGALSDAGKEHVRLQRQQQKQRDAARAAEQRVPSPEPARETASSTGGPAHDEAAVDSVSVDTAEATEGVLAEAAETRAVVADVLDEVRRCRAHYRLGGDDAGGCAAGEDPAAATVHRMSDLVYQLQVLRAGMMARGAGGDGVHGNRRSRLPDGSDATTTTIAMGAEGPAAAAAATPRMGERDSDADDATMSVSAASDAGATPPRGHPSAPRHEGRSPASHHAVVPGVSEVGLDDTPPRGVGNVGTSVGNRAPFLAAGRDAARRAEVADAAGTTQQHGDRDAGPAPSRSLDEGFAAVRTSPHRRRPVNGANGGTDTDRRAGVRDPEQSLFP
jgi:hypothetical protein